MKQQNIKELPIELKIYTSHKLPDESLTEAQKTKMKAEHCAFMAEGIFCVIEKVCLDAAFADRSIEPLPLSETLVRSLGYMAGIGTSLLFTCTELIDQLEIPSEKSKTAVGKT